MGNDDASGQVVALHGKKEKTDERVDQCFPRCELFGVPTKKHQLMRVRFAIAGKGNVVGYVFGRLADKPPYEEPSDKAEGRPRVALPRTAREDAGTATSATRKPASLRDCHGHPVHYSLLAKWTS